MTRLSKIVKFVKELFGVSSGGPEAAGESYPGIYY